MRETTDPRIRFDRRDHARARAIEFLVSWAIGFALFAGLALVLCSCGASAREQQLRTTHTALNAAVDGYLAGVEVYVARAVEDEDEAALDRLEPLHEKVTAAMVLAYQVLAAATLYPDKVTLEEVARAARDLYAAIQDARGVL